MVRPKSLAMGAAFLSLMTSPGIAADLAVQHQKAATVRRAAPVEVACIRWVEQNYSWYNYCDPVPYYGRRKYVWPAGQY